MLCKLLLNSLYGKFGMNPRMTEGVVETLSEASTRDYFPDDFRSITDELNINFYQKVFTLTSSRETREECTGRKSLDYNNDDEYNKVLRQSLLISRTLGGILEPLEFQDTSQYYQFLQL
jgi:hypothetical protein